MLTIRKVLLVLSALLLSGERARRSRPVRQTPPPVPRPRKRRSPAAVSGAWSIRLMFCPAWFRRPRAISAGRRKNPTYEEVSSEAAPGTRRPCRWSTTRRRSLTKNCSTCVLAQHRSDGQRLNQQFCDHGSQYRTGIFYYDDEQKRLAEASKTTLDRNKPFKDPIVTEITRAAEFYPAEDYHQDFYIKNPLRYKYYRSGCGRDARLQQLWGKAPE